MDDCPCIDALSSDELRASFGDLMASIVTAYGDDAPAAQSDSDQDQAQESEAKS
jgi:hypothetical protein